MKTYQRATSPCLCVSSASVFERRRHCRAFTLLELLVVIGIIGILAGIMLVSFGGSTEKARAAKCMSNMRNLAVAAQSYGMAESYYPVASTFEFSEMGKKSNGKIGVVFYEWYGWISWNEPDPAKSSNSRSKGYDKSHRNSSWHISTYSDEKDTYHSITNGALFPYMQHSTACYMCPEHQRVCQKRKMRAGWSYVENALFGMDRTAFGGSAEAYHWRYYGDLKATIKQNGKNRECKLSPDRVLLFAEMPFVMNGFQNVEYNAGSGSGASATDCTLQYETTTGKSCSSPESIGFNHKVGNNYVAHVAFADGHVSRITLPANASEAVLQNLTRWLCTGSEIEFSGGQYSEVSGSN